MRRNVELLVVASLAAPFVGTAIGTALPVTIANLQTGASELSALVQGALLLTFYVGGLLGLPATLLIGLPAHAMLSKFQMHQAWHYAISGCAPGMAIGSLVLFLFSDATGNYAHSLQILAVGALTGVATALTFWLIRRPDRDPPNPATAPS